jgi:hypothetical protein
VLANDGMLAGSVELTYEEGESARIAVRVQVQREGHTIPSGPPLHLTGRHIDPAARALPEVLASLHRILLLHVILRAGTSIGAGSNGPFDARRTAGAREVVIPGVSLEGASIRA